MALQNASCFLLPLLSMWLLLLKKTKWRKCFLFAEAHVEPTEKAGQCQNTPEPRAPVTFCFLSTFFYHSLGFSFVFCCWFFVLLCLFFHSHSLWRIKCYRFTQRLIALPTVLSWSSCIVCLMPFTVSTACMYLYLHHLCVYQGFPARTLWALRSRPSFVVGSVLWIRGCLVASVREGNGTPLQCSCLENPRDRGAWWAAVYGVAQSRTRLKRLSSSSGNSSSCGLYFLKTNSTHHPLPRLLPTRSDNQKCLQTSAPKFSLGGGGSITTCVCVCVCVCVYTHTYIYP